MCRSCNACTRGNTSVTGMCISPYSEVEERAGRCVCVCGGGDMRGKGTLRLKFCMKYCAEVCTSNKGTSRIYMYIVVPKVDIFDICSARGFWMLRQDTKSFGDDQSTDWSANNDAVYGLFLCVAASAMSGLASTLAQVDFFAFYWVLICCKFYSRFDFSFSFSNSHHFFAFFFSHAFFACIYYNRLLHKRMPVVLICTRWSLPFTSGMHVCGEGKNTINITDRYIQCSNAYFEIYNTPSVFICPVFLF